MNQPNPDLVNYTVISAAVTIDTGRLDPQTKRKEVVRAMKGQTFDAPADNSSVLTLLSMRAIRPTEKVTGRERVTARTMVQAFRQGSEHDMAEVVEAVVPIDAPKTDGGVLTPADL